MRKNEYDSCSRFHWGMQENSLQDIQYSDCQCIDFSSRQYYSDSVTGHDSHHGSYGNARDILSWLRIKFYKATVPRLKITFPLAIVHESTNSTQIDIPATTSQPYLQTLYFIKEAMFCYHGEKNKLLECSSKFQIDNHRISSFI